MIIMERQAPKLSAFSVLLIMAALALVGLALIPLLNVQYLPTPKQSSLDISYTWPDASAYLIEQTVTSRIEGMVNTVDGVNEVSSVSSKGRGTVTVKFKKDVKIEVVCFEISMQIRQLYNRLPLGVSYPVMSLSSSGTQEHAMLTYTLNADLPPDQIEKYAHDHLLQPLSQIKGVNSVRLTGANPYEWMVTFDPDRMRAVGVSVEELQQAINDNLGTDQVGTVVQSTPKGEYQMTLKVGYGRLSSADAFQNFVERFPIKSVEGHVVYLQDFATVTYRETLPSSYYRINGLNTVNISIFPNQDCNVPQVARQLKELMSRLEVGFPPGFSVLLVYDASEFIAQELDRIAVRTGLSVVILLLFVFVVSRSWRYLLVILITMAANIAIAFIFYKVFNVQIHLYSLAGITISLGVIIDTAIIMIDHYSYYHDRRSFIAILAALLTTIGSLSIIFFLPDNQKANLVDFAMVIIINLSISLLIALLFIPSLLEKLPVQKGVAQLTFRARRCVARFSNVYSRYIAWSRRHRWLYVVVLILGFGVPIHLLPDKLVKDRKMCKGFWPDLYHKTIGSQWYQTHKEKFEVVLGGAFRLFTESLSPSGFYRVAERPTLYIQAAMPEGCSIHQLNDIMRYMENYLSRFDEIDMFKTNITDYDQGQIAVNFKKEYEYGRFPLVLKGNVIQQAINYGGASWDVYGIDDQSFNNDVTSGYKSRQIVLRGYNYDLLYDFAQDLKKELSTNPRVSGPEIYGKVGWRTNIPKTEYYIQYDYRKIAATGLHLNDYYHSLEQQLFNQQLESYFNGKNRLGVSLVSAGSETFDLWKVQHNLVPVDSVRHTKLSDIGTIDKRRMGNEIYKHNQEYILTVAFDFIGPSELCVNEMDDQVDRLNMSVLPVGYKAEMGDFYWDSEEQKTQAWLIFLVIVIIYFLSAILFESVLKPLVIILMIPVSFIGVFLTFALGGFGFDQGGFAAFIMLSGIVVNAGIYLINEFNILPQSLVPFVDRYMKAYNRKIIPVLLTICSTILGLIPFLYDGKNEVFWFSFAVGTMGGMVFSLIALLVYLPVFLPSSRSDRS
mgnify:CR=1 FL=1